MSHAVDYKDYLKSSSKRRVNSPSGRFVKSVPIWRSTPDLLTHNNVVRFETSSSPENQAEGATLNIKKINVIGVCGFIFALLVSPFNAQVSSAIAVPSLLAMMLGK